MSGKKTEEVNQENKPAAETKTEVKSELSVAELTDLLQRNQANFENYRKQVQLQLEDMKKMAARDMVRQILPIIDNFELALKNVNHNQGANAEFIQGMELIHAQLLQALQQNNVTIIDTKDKIFDPYLHEALMKVPSELSENKIIEEFQKGFLMHGKVLRHAKVKISAGKKS